MDPLGDFSFLFTSNPHPMWIFDIGTLRILEVNDAAIAAYGYTRDEFQDLTLLDLRDPSDHKRLLDYTTSNVVRGMDDAGMWHHRRKDGSLLVVNIRSHDVVYKGRACELVLAMDISDRVKAEQLEKERARLLQRSIDELVSAVAMMVERRDPYTAGHQHRVAALSYAIGTKLDLSQDQLSGIAIMGELHDIGKIAVPAEILTKPGTLSPVEYELIKVHSQAGYDVLKAVHFPWPVAEVVLQHHERLDGSGYPRGLRGSEILLEAKIIGVADVIEAMSTHRPYRPALSVDVTVDEIESGAGKKYDPEIAAAAVSVLRNGLCILQPSGGLAGSDNPRAVHPRSVSPLVMSANGR